MVHGWITALHYDVAQKPKWWRIDVLILVRDLVKFFGVRPTGVLHVGAHEAEESSDYQKAKWGPVIWVDMLPDKYEALKKRFANDPANLVIHAACWDTDGVKLPVFRADNGQSSSLLRPEFHLASHPSVSFVEESEITTSRLDAILPATARFDFINIDTQGAELRILRGLGRYLENVRWAYLEVNTRRLYADCALMSEIDSFMSERGFFRMATVMAGAAGWGDALYIKMNALTLREKNSIKLGALRWKVHSKFRKVARYLSRSVRSS